MLLWTAAVQLIHSVIIITFYLSRPRIIFDVEPFKLWPEPLGSALCGKAAFVSIMNRRGVIRLKARSSCAYFK